MTPDQLRQWRRDRGYSQAKAGELLGLTDRTLSNYEQGVFPIPRSVALACAALALGITDYPCDLGGG